MEQGKSVFNPPELLIQVNKAGAPFDISWRPNKTVMPFPFQAVSPSSLGTTNPICF
jgi:hypothetical protein